MASSEDQKTKFEDHFKALVKQSENEIKWDGNFIWIDIPSSTVPSQVKLDHVVEQFTAKLKDRYHALLTKFKNNAL